MIPPQGIHSGSGEGSYTRPPSLDNHKVTLNLLALLGTLRCSRAHGVRDELHNGVRIAVGIWATIFCVPLAIFLISMEYGLMHRSLTRRRRTCSMGLSRGHGEAICNTIAIVLNKVHVVLADIHAA